MAESKIPDMVPTIVNTQTSITESATLAYTDVSFNIPAKSMYAFMVFTGYSNHKPEYTALSTSDSSMSEYQTLAYNDHGRYASIAGYTDLSMTVYVWASFAAGGSNSQVFVKGWYKPV